MVDTWSRNWTGDCFLGWEFDDQAAVNVGILVCIINEHPPNHVSKKVHWECVFRSHHYQYQIKKPISVTTQYCHMIILC